ncbi:hypothetical protein AB0J83_35925 [Actinoplanes sp. NPDC049596]
MALVSLGEGLALLDADGDGVGEGDDVGAVGVGTGGCAQWHSVFVGFFV